MVDEGVEREKKREEGGYHLGWDGGGLGRVEANEERVNDASVQWKK
jgi:hypothetical protein